jgi:hypothetical protein
MMKIKKQQIVYKSPPLKVICSPNKMIYSPNKMIYPPNNVINSPDYEINSPDLVILHQKQTPKPLCITPKIKNMTKYMQRRIKNYPDQTNHIVLSDKSKYSDKGSVYSFKYKTPIQPPSSYTDSESILNGKFVFTDMHIIYFIYCY